MITNNNQQFTTNNNFVDLSTLEGTGVSTMFVTEVTGVLLGIEIRPGSYEVTDRRTGQLLTKPNSWTSHWLVTEDDGSQHEALMSWPTYVDPKTNQVRAWSRYNKSIDLAAAAANGDVLHFWRDERNFYHLEKVMEKAAPTMPVMPSVAPWNPPVAQ